ncbi:hypothetical protein [Maribacter sp. Asnod2-G09]|uniref:hypothetical protein n=1 Tax=Maribacter sp. Asnod2-G09 TaxID=3160577 RepID=UPI0038701CCA
MAEHINKYFIFPVIFLVLILKSGICYSQNSIDLSNVDLIVYNEYDTDMRFFSEKNKNQFIELYLEFDKDWDTNFITADIEYDDIDDTVTLEEINLYEGDILLNVNEIKKTSFSHFLKQELEINESSYYRAGEDTNKLVLKFLTNDIATIQELYFQEKKHNQSFGSSRVSGKDDNEERWRIYNAKFYATIDLNFGNDKHIYLLLNKDRIDFTIIPLIKNEYLLSDDDGISTFQNTSKYKTSYVENFERIEFVDFAAITKNKNDKYELMNTSKENVLKTAYDTIRFNQYFIITQNENQIDIFDSFYEKVKIDHIKSAYLYRNGIEILNDRGANYYNNEAKIIEKFPRMVTTVCGTVNEVTYTLDYNDELKTSTLTKIDGGFASNLDKRRAYYLEEIKATDSVTFLNNEKEYYWDENDSFLGKSYMYPELLKITRSKKNGIFEYNYVNTDKVIDTISKDWKKEVNYLPTKTQRTIVLPINNDSIIFNRKDGLTYFYRKNKVGLFPRHKKVQYNSIQQITNSFYAISRKGKKGWLDIKTNIEYFEN